MTDSPDGGRTLPAFDRAHCAAVVTRALQVPGGSELVTGSLTGVPGAVVGRRRSGLFGASPGQVQIADWRYAPAASSRLAVAHVVGGVVIAESVMRPSEAGAHVAMVLSRQLAEYGPRVLPEILAVLEGLSVAADCA
jgi:hypothetical protein